MKKIMLILAITLTANMAKADDLSDGWAAKDNGDYATVLNLWKPLAEQGNAEAQFVLGNLYDYGEGVNQDYREAVRLYRLAADQGHADAQHNLGLMYANGWGVLQDNKKAHMWFNIARSNGSYWADDNIKILTQRMTPAAIDKAQDMAERCLASDYQDC